MINLIHIDTIVSEFTIFSIKLKASSPRLDLINNFRIDGHREKLPVLDQSHLSQELSMFHKE